MLSRRSRAGLVSLALVLAACSAQPPASQAPASEALASQAATSAPTPVATATPTPGPTPVAGSFPAALVENLVVRTDQVFTEPVACDDRPDCLVPLDILAPLNGEALPTIVLVPGGPVPFVERRYMEALAAALADRGAVVFLTAYRSSTTGNTTDDMVNDVRCAIRFARAVTSEYGGDPNRLVLAGHSVGSTIALRIAVRADADATGCLADGGGVPETVVAIAGFSVTFAPAAGEPGPPIQMIGGSDDPESAGGESTAQELRDAGFSAEYQELEGIDHLEVIDPEANPIIVDLIFGAT